MNANVFDAKLCPKLAPDGLCCAKWTLCGLLLAMFFWSCGCTSSDAPKLAKAKGTVKARGKPLANIGVTFFPTGSGPIAMGRTDEHGQFVMMTIVPGDGAPVGTHKVTLGAAEESQSEFAVAARIPKKYALPDTSGLTANVEEGRLNEFQFEVTP